MSPGGLPGPQGELSGGFGDVLASPGSWGEGSGLEGVGTLMPVAGTTGGVWGTHTHTLCGSLFSGLGTAVQDKLRFS